MKKTTPTNKKSAGEHFHVGTEKILVKGARTHNLKNISVEMPRNTMIAITGLSGSGKSSLAFDTIFAEGQRRYVESLSAYARQFLSQMPKPDVDEITGLSPAISIDQKSGSRNPRSTIATMTEIYDYLRVLYARVGRPYSPISGAEIKKMTNDQIMSFVQDKIQEFSRKQEKTNTQKEVMGVHWNEAMIQVYAPVVRGRKGEYYQMLYDALTAGYTYARIDGVIKNLRDQVVLVKNKKHDIDLLVDEFSVHEFYDNATDFTMRLSEAVERAVAESEGLIRVVFGGTAATNSSPAKKKASSSDAVDTEEFLLSAKLVSPEDGFAFPEIEPRMFSFNSPYGACDACKGLGTKHLFGNERDDQCTVCQGSRLRREAGFVLLGDEKLATAFAEKIENISTSVPSDFLDGNGILKKNSEFTRKGLNIYEFVQMSIADAHDFIMSLDLTKSEMEVAGILLNEIESRLQFMLNVGLKYLTLNRRANTISGGEAQRIRLASQLGSKLVGALYVLDEPTIGLHERDNERLIKTLLELRNLGNTIIVVEHDEEVIHASDYIIDIGPGAGRHGGEVMVADYLQPLLDAKKNSSGSLTLDYLRGDAGIPVPEFRRQKDRGTITIAGGKIHNIENLALEIPLGRFLVISGVSGSGKSSFMYDILYANLQAKYERKYRSAKVFNATRFETSENVSRVILVDQSPIGRTPRSNPATYTGAWGFIRELLSETHEARLRGWGPGRFSFNVKGGRCENCQGRGEIAVEMHFLPTVYVICDICNGKRFDKETLSVKFKNKNAYEILEMTIEEATEFYKDIPAVTDRLGAMMDVGLGYLKLGQPANTLSGGESQRVKISSELYRPVVQKTVYLLDEPTVGLHFEDVKRLIEILNKLVDRGNSVVIIEHNMEVIKSADYIIDFGPEGGSAGGRVIAKGTPEEVANNPASATGQYLKKALRSSRK